LLRKATTFTQAATLAYFLIRTMLSRIPGPQTNDVLAGRGGGVNSHPGNVRFRNWVLERRNAYILAFTKADKVAVAREVVRLVKAQDPPGRFLMRDPVASVSVSHHAGTSGCWLELDEANIMAKVSQALREKATSIRAAHGQPSHHHRRNKEYKDPKTKTQALERIAPGLLPGHVWSRTSVSLDHGRVTAAASRMPSSRQDPQLVTHDGKSGAFSLRPRFLLPPFPLYKPALLERAHSLALSDISASDSDFVDPFRDDGFDYPSANTPKQPALGAMMERVVSGTSSGNCSKPHLIEDSLDSSTLLGRMDYDEFHWRHSHPVAHKSRAPTGILP
jgi:hypothetical protein